MQGTTKHIHSRMSQRGITGQMVELTLEHGEISQDKYILTRKVIDDLLEDIEGKRRALVKARDLGGHTVVVGDGAMITAYRTEKGKRTQRGR